MKTEKRQKLQFFAMLAAAILLIVMGIVLVERVISQYSRVIEEDREGDHMELARSLDLNISGYIERYSNILSYVVQRRGFTEAEELWKETGDGQELLFRLNENLMLKDKLVTTMLSVYEGEVLLSTDGSTDYFFPTGAGERGAVSVRPCVAGDGTVSLAFCMDTPNGLTHAALIDLQAFYQTVTSNLFGKKNDRIMLSDAGERIVIHNCGDGVHINYTEELNRDNCDYAGLTLMQAAQREGVSGSVLYDACDPAAEGDTYRARLTMIPAAASENGIFSVGIAMNYDAEMRPLRMASIRLLAYGGMVVSGIFLLLLIILWVRHKGVSEIALLQKKNEEMEKLNQKTMELAHHQRLETIGTLTSSISHEFNNLLTPIMGYSLLTLENLPDEECEIYDYVLEIYNSSQKAKTIISRLSDLSRKNSALTFHYASPDELVRQALEVTKPAKPKNVTIKPELACNNVWMHCNEIQISQLLLNLILNAFQVMEEAGGVLTITTGADEDNILIKVADTGPGIPKEIIPRLFEPFFTTKESGHGTGLGLAIVCQVVDDHRGTIEVDSVPGEGTCFTVSFPIATQENP